jgi:secreted trypsin-like serine protease
MPIVRTACSLVCACLILLSTAALSTAAPTGRIIGGIRFDDATWGAGYGSVVSIAASTGRAHAPISHMCTGVVIAPQLVLTARHCVEEAYWETDSNQLLVAARTRINQFKEQDAIAVTSIQLTPDARDKHQQAGGDLAILGLKRKVPGAVPVQLAGADDAAYWGAGAGRLEGAQIAGFGVQRDGDVELEREYGPTVPVLRSVTVPIHADAACAEALHGGANAERVLCVGQEPDAGAGIAARQSCFGDSGGPLIAAAPDGAGPTKLIGITSFGTGTTCRFGVSTYMRIAPRRAWIDAVIALGPAPTTTKAQGTGGAVRNARRVGFDIVARMMMTRRAPAGSTWLVQSSADDGSWLEVGRGASKYVPIRIPPGQDGQVWLRVYQRRADGTRLKAWSGVGPTSRRIADRRAPSAVKRLTARRVGVRHRLIWTAARDDDRIRGYVVEQRRPGQRWTYDGWIGCWKCEFSPKARADTRSWHYLLPGRRQFRIAAVDRAGNLGPWATSGVTTPGPNA